MGTDCATPYMPFKINERNKILLFGKFSLEKKSRQNKNSEVQTNKSTLAMMLLHKRPLIHCTLDLFAQRMTKNGTILS